MLLMYMMVLCKITGELFCRGRCTNDSKTQFIIRRQKTKCVPPNIRLRLGDVLISPTPTVKYLGLTIDEHLSFSSYVTEVEKKVGTKLAMFRKIRDNNNLTPAARKTFYCSFIQAHLEYGSNAFVHCLHTTQHDRLTRIANRAVRIVFGFPWHYDVSVLHTRYGLAPIALRYQLKGEVKAKIKISPVVVFGVLSRMVLVRES